MALTDEVIARIADDRLLQLTNMGDTTKTTVDATRLGLAATDAIAEFGRAVGIPFDLTVATHVDAGIDGVMCKLFRRSGGDSENDGRSYCKRWKEQLADLRAQVGAGARVDPATNAVQVPTADPSGETPYFDRDKFGDLRPDMLKSSQDDDNR